MNDLLTTIMTVTVLISKVKKEMEKKGKTSLEKDEITEYFAEATGELLEDFQKYTQEKTNINKN